MSHARHTLDKHDVSFLVVFRSSMACTCQLQLLVSAYEAASVCPPDSYSSEDGLQRTLPPLLHLPISGVNISVTGDLVSFSDGGQLVLPTGDCSLCPAGKFTEKFAASRAAECRPACEPGFYSSTGLDLTTDPCKPCKIGSYNPEPRQRACLPCPPDRPSTNGPGAQSVEWCWFAQVGVEEVKAVGRKLRVTAFGVIRPAAFASTADILAIFKDEPSAEPWRKGYERQVAYTYTSVEQSPSDESYGTQDLRPGAQAVSDFSFTFLFPSAGSGVYTVNLFRNSSGTRGVSLPFGGIVAKYHFRLKSFASVPGLEWEVIGANRPSDGVRIFNRALSDALFGGRRRFTIQQLTDLGVSKLSFSNYVKTGDRFLGQAETYLKPVKVDCGPGPPDPPVDLSDPALFFLEGCVPEKNDFWRQSYGLMCAPGSFSLAPRELASILPPLLPKNFSYSLHPDIPWDEIHDHSRVIVSDEPLTPADLRASWSPSQLCPPGILCDPAILRSETLNPNPYTRNPKFANESDPLDLNAEQALLHALDASSEHVDHQVPGTDCQLCGLLRMS